MRIVVGAVFGYDVYQSLGLGIPKPPKCMPYKALRPRGRIGSDSLKEFSKTSFNFVY